MPTCPVLIYRILPGALSLAMATAVPAQVVRTLPETRITPDDQNVANTDFDETTFDADDLALHNVNSLEDFSSLAANLHFVHSDTAGYGNVVSMRGLTNTLFFSPPAVGLYVDDVPFADVFTYSSELLKLDAARIHHGPQGASFGRNAPGGLIELTTLRPGPELRFGGSAEYGSYDSFGFTAYSSGPLAEGLSHTLQFYWRERDGYVKDNFLGDHVDERSVVGGLASIIYTPAPDLEFKLRIAAERVDDGGQRLTPTPLAVISFPFSATIPNPAYTGDRYSMNSDLRGQNEIERYQLSLHARKTFEWGSVKSITSFQHWDLGPQTVDLDFSPAPLATSSINQDQELWTQEFRIESPEDAGPLTWRGGLFYLNKENSGSTRRMFPFDPTNPFGSIVVEGNRFTIEEDNFAAYGKAAYDLGNGLTVEAGGRLDYTEASMDRLKTMAPFFPVPPQSPSSDGVYFSPTAGLIYTVAEGVRVFARSGLGIKPHGYSAFSDDPATASFGEERNWSNEAGVEYRADEANLNVVVRAFWNNIEDYHLNVQNPMSTDFVIVNADEVRSRGVEAEVQWRPIDPLLIHGSAGWTDIEFEDYTDPFTLTNYDGNNVPFVPELTASAGFRYDLPGGFFVGSTVRAAEDTYYDAANTGAFLQDAYWVWNAQAGYQAEKWGIVLYGNNILDEDYYTFINPQIAAGSVGDPQLFGVRVTLDIW